MPQRSALAEGWPVWVLAVAQTLSYASLYYCFAALIFYWHRDLGWAKSTLALGPMVSILLGAALAPFVGRLVDTGRGPEAMVFGAMLGAVALIMMSQVETTTGWMIAWGLQGIGQTLSTYEACFAFFIRRLGPSAKKAIIRVTLVAGFAGTISLPAYALLADLMGWRHALWVGAAVVAFLVVPMNYFGTRAIRRMAPPPQPKATAAPITDATGPSRRLRFWLVTAIFTFLAMNQWMILNFLVPIFVMQGYSEAQAIFAASLVGPAQVVGRFALMRYEARLNTMSTALITLLTLGFAAGILAASGFSYGIVIAFVLIQGSAVGIVTILRPVLIAETMGNENYGETAGRMQVFSATSGAFAPMVGALFLEGPGLYALIGFSLLLSTLSLLCLQVLRR